MDVCQLIFRLGRQRAPLAFFHDRPLTCNHFDRFFPAKAALDQKASDDGAGATDSAPAVQVDRSVREMSFSNRPQYRAHDIRDGNREVRNREAIVADFVPQPSRD